MDGAIKFIYLRHDAFSRSGGRLLTPAASIPVAAAQRAPGQSMRDLNKARATYVHPFFFPFPEQELLRCWLESR